jgi:hypothetical protein
MDLLGKARRLESRIASTFDLAVKGLGRTAPREPLEIVHAILDAVEQEVQPTGRGTRAFPFNRIDVSVLAPSRCSTAQCRFVRASSSGWDHQVARRRSSRSRFSTSIAPVKSGARLNSISSSRDWSRRRS